MAKEQPLYVAYCDREFLVIDHGQPTGMLLGAGPLRRFTAGEVANTPWHNELSRNEDGQCAFTRWETPEVTQEVVFTGIKPVDYFDWIENGATPQCENLVEATNLSGALLTWSGESVEPTAKHFAEIGVPSDVIDLVNRIYAGHAGERRLMIKLILKAALAGPGRSPFRKCYPLSYRELWLGAEEARLKRSWLQRMFGRQPLIRGASKTEIVDYVFYVYGRRPEAWMPTNTALFRIYGMNA